MIRRSYTYTEAYRGLRTIGYEGRGFGSSKGGRFRSHRHIGFGIFGILLLVPPSPQSIPSAFGPKSSSRRRQSFQRWHSTRLFRSGLLPYGTTSRHQQPQERVCEDQSPMVWPASACIRPFLIRESLLDSARSETALAGSRPINPGYALMGNLDVLRQTFGVAAYATRTSGAINLSRRDTGCGPCRSA
jgi:hypothetical protein